MCTKPLINTHKNIYLFFITGFSDFFSFYRIYENIFVKKKKIERYLKRENIKYFLLTMFCHIFLSIIGLSYIELFLRRVIAM